MGTPATKHAYRVTVMSDSDGSLERDDRHHRRSHSRSPVSQGCAGETLAEREKRRLAEAAVQVGPRAGQPQAAPDDPGPPAQEPVPAGEAAPAAQAAATAAPPPPQASHAQGAATAAPTGRAAAPSTLPPRGDGPHAGPERLAGSRHSRGAGQGGRLVPPPHKAQPHLHQPPKPYLPKAAFLKGRPRPVRPPPAPKRTPPGITLPQPQRQQDARRVVQEGGDGERAGQGAGRGNAGRGAEGDRQSARGPTQGTDQSAHSKERGQGHGQATRASDSGGGQAQGADQSAGSGRRDTGHSAGHG